MNRRQFLQNLSLLTGASLIPIGIQGWAARSVAQTPTPKRLIVIFLRGGADGLNIVIPHQDPAYAEVRPTLAIPAPGEKDGALELDGQFGLHPGLQELFPLWQQKSLAFVHACGSPSDTRSHFEAQDNMETAVLNRSRSTDGWMNRLLASLPQGTPVQAVNVGSTVPLILKGKMPATNLPRGKAASQALPLDQPQVYEAFDQLYRGSDPLSQTYQKAMAARRIVLAELETEMIQANRGAASPSQLAQDARNLARLMRGDARTQLAFLDVGGWDTHVNQGGRLYQLLKPLASGLTTLVQELGPLYQETVIVVLSEFGRTVRENGNRGTDHGHGNVLWLLGGQIQGGKVYGTWPGLQESQLYENRDLAVMTDFRDAIAPILQQTFSLGRIG